MLTLPVLDGGPLAKGTNWGGETRQHRTPILELALGESAADVAHRLLHEAHVVTVPGESFGSADHIRLSYATSEKEIERGLERMKKFFAAL